MAMINEWRIINYQSVNLGRNGIVWYSVRNYSHKYLLHKSDGMATNDVHYFYNQLGPWQ
jgi:hypothetical protein